MLIVNILSCSLQKINIWSMKNTISSIRRENILVRLSLDIICSSQFSSSLGRTSLSERCSLLMTDISANKQSSIFLHQVEAIIHIWIRRSRDIKLLLLWHDQKRKCAYRGKLPHPQNNHLDTCNKTILLCWCRLHPCGSYLERFRILSHLQRRIYFRISRLGVFAKIRTNQFKLVILRFLAYTTDTIS